MWRGIRIRTNRIDLCEAVRSSGLTTDAPGIVAACGLGGRGAGELEPCVQCGGSPGGGFFGGGADDVARGKALDGYGCG